MIYLWGGISELAGIRAEPAGPEEASLSQSTEQTSDSFWTLTPLRLDWYTSYKTDFHFIYIKTSNISNEMLSFFY